MHWWSSSFPFISKWFWRWCDVIPHLGWMHFWSLPVQYSNQNMFQKLDVSFLIWKVVRHLLSSVSYKEVIWVTGPRSKTFHWRNETNLVFETLHSDLLDFWTLSFIWYSKKLENTMFQKLNLFLTSGEGGGNYFVGCPFERANLNHWTTYVRITTAI
jgi:hypothetical protein